jgi:hypothetical protein
MATFDTSGKVAYMYDQETDTWYAVSGAVNTAASYTWLGTNTFSNTVILEDVVRAQAGVNNFQNPSARDAAITSPVNGIVCFVRQNDGGTPINQVQYYYNGSWRYVNDSTDLQTKLTNYTLQLSDAGKTIVMDSSSDTTVTIPTNSSVPFLIGQRLDIIRYGTGNVTIGGSVVINSKNSNKKIATRYSGATLIKIETDTWLLIGDLTA